MARGVPLDIPPELNPLLRRSFVDSEDDDPLCGLCSNCPNCASARETRPLGWCVECLNCGCWATGRFGRGIFGQCLLHPFLLRDVWQTPRSTIAVLDGLRFECHGRAVDGQALARLKGRHVSAWVEFNGVTQFAPIPRPVLTQITKLTGWQFER